MQDNDTRIKKGIAEDITKTAIFCHFQINKHGERGLELCKIRCQKRLEYYERVMGTAFYRKSALDVCGKYIKAGEEELVKIIIAFVLVI